MENKQLSDLEAELELSRQAIKSDLVEIANHMTFVAKLSSYKDKIKSKYSDLYSKAGDNKWTYYSDQKCDCECENEHCCDGVNCVDCPSCDELGCLSFVELPIELRENKIALYSMLAGAGVVLATLLVAGIARRK